MAEKMLTPDEVAQQIGDLVKSLALKADARSIFLTLVANAGVIGGMLISSGKFTHADVAGFLSEATLKALDSKAPAAPTAH